MLAGAEHVNEPPGSVQGFFTGWFPRPKKIPFSVDNHLIIKNFFKKQASFAKVPPVTGRRSFKSGWSAARCFGAATIQEAGIDLLTRWAKRLQGQPREPRGCPDCGLCCASFGGYLRASPADLVGWIDLGRSDLLARVNHLGWIWIDPQTGWAFPQCPYLDRRDDGTTCCAIHETKPDMCRDYPTLAHDRRCLNGFFPALPLLACEVLGEGLTAQLLDWTYLA